jgi:Zn-dependent protease
MNLDQIVQAISIWILPVLFAVTLHEAAHGYAAKRLGDSTAQMLGRLSLNPLRHVDPVGTVLVPATLLLLHTGFLFGWAKPVPVNFNNLRHPRRDMALVAAAGPGANLLMALIWALVAKLGVMLAAGGVGFAVPLALMGEAGIAINLVLMVLNLLPIPPLDGGRVLSGLVPPVWANRLDRIEPYGLIILVVLLVSNVLGQIIYPIITWLSAIIYGVFGLPGF